MVVQRADAYGESLLRRSQILGFSSRNGGGLRASSHHTIFGMLDSLANARTDGAKTSVMVAFASDSEGILQGDRFVRSGNTAGSLLAVTNSYTSNIMRNYSQSKCRPLFDDNMLDLHVHIASIAVKLLSVLLESAHAAWGGDFRIAAAGLHSWEGGALRFCIYGSLRAPEGILLCAAALQTFLYPYRTVVAWASTRRASLLFGTRPRRRKQGQFVSLSRDAANCGSGYLLCPRTAGASDVSTRRRSQGFGAERFRLFNDPEMGADDLETMRLKRMVGLGDRVSGMFEKEGVCYIRGDDDCEFVFGDFVSSDESPSPEAPEPEATRDERSASTEIEESDYDEWSMFGPPPDDDQEDADT